MSPEPTTAKIAELERRLSEEQRKRRRVQLALGTVLALLLLGGGTVAWLWHEAEEARRQAEHQQIEAVLGRPIE
jgi:hypothetical protein